ncbi:MAG: Wzz/FepE/Etk N-terminal domain-containing protein [Candidatus Cloacimonadaceae bacterium]
MENRNNIFNLLLIFARQKKLIIWITLIAAVAAVIFSLLTPQIWTSRANFKPDAASAGVSINLGDLGGIMSSLLGSSSGDAQSAMIILRSRTLNEEVIRKFHLIQYFKIEEADTLKAMDIALELLKGELLSVVLNEENGLISLSVSTKDKQLSKDMADFYLARLENYNRELKLTKGKRNRQFLQSRVASVRNDIDSLALALRDFQKKNKAIDVPTQMNALVTLYSEAVSQKMIVDLELEMAKQNFDSESPVLKDLSLKQKVIAERIKDLEKGSGQVKPSYIMDIDKLPDLTLQYTQLMINLEIQKKVFEFIYPQFEAARIEEMRDMPTIEVIDYPRLAGQRSYPRRAFICIVATFIAFLVSLVLAYIKHQMELNSATVKQIKDAIFRKHS